MTKHTRGHRPALEGKEQRPGERRFGFLIFFFLDLTALADPHFHHVSRHEGAGSRGLVGVAGSSLQLERLVAHGTQFLVHLEVFLCATALVTLWPVAYLFDELLVRIPLQP